MTNWSWFWFVFINCILRMLPIIPSKNISPRACFRWWFHLIFQDGKNRSSSYTSVLDSCSKMPMVLAKIEFFPWKWSSLDSNKVGFSHRRSWKLPESYHPKLCSIQAYSRRTRNESSRVLFDYLDLPKLGWHPGHALDLGNPLVSHALHQN